MENNLSKYDVMNNKMEKLSKIVGGSFLTSLTLKPEKKVENYKKVLDKLLNDAHIIFEMLNDLDEYLSIDNNKSIINNEIPLTYVYNLAKTSKEMEKILLFFAIVMRRDEKFIDSMIEKICKNKDMADMLIYDLYHLLTEKDREVIELMDKDDYYFHMLSEEYKNMILEDHKKFMDSQIYPNVTKKEDEKIEILKGSSIFMKNMNANLNVDISSKINEVKNDMMLSKMRF